MSNQIEFRLTDNNVTFDLDYNDIRFKLSDNNITSYISLYNSNHPLYIKLLELYNRGFLS